MAQAGLLFDNEGRVITVTNDSTTTAITAGDILACEDANDDVLTQTTTTARAAYSSGDIKVKQASNSNTNYQKIVGVAIDDIPAGGIGPMAMEGIFMHPVDENVEAGDSVQFAETTSMNLQALDVETATFGNVVNPRDKIGKALTGGSANKEIIIWKLTL